MSAWRTLAHSVGDSLLGWLLVIPRDLGLIALSLLTACVILVIRYVLSDQASLRVANHDLRRLAERAGGLKTHEVEELARVRRTRLRVLGLRLRLEALSIAVSLPFMAMVGSWSNSRMAEERVVPTEAFSFRLETPASRVGQLVHLVPHPGVIALDGWVRVVESTDDSPRGRATWQLQFRPASGWNGRRVQAGRGTSGVLPRWNVQIRLAEETVSHELDFSRPGVTTVLPHPGGETSRLECRVYRPFGLVPGSPSRHWSPMLPPYLAFTWLFFQILRRVCRVA